MTSLEVKYNYLFRFYLFIRFSMNIFNFRVAKISSAKQISSACGFNFCVAKISLQSFGLLGRPKWTRTTDLVLIRHAL